MPCDVFANMKALSMARINLINRAVSGTSYFHPLWARNIKWLCYLSCSNKSVASSCKHPVQLRGERLTYWSFFSYLEKHLQLRFKNSESFFSNYFCHNAFSTNNRFSMTTAFVNCVLLTDQRRFQLADFISFSIPCTLPQWRSRVSWRPAPRMTEVTRALQNQNWWSTLLLFEAIN
jgi:hypothetical protein